MYHQNQNYSLDGDRGKRNTDKSKSLRRKWPDIKGARRQRHPSKHLIMFLNNKSPQQRSPHTFRHVLTWSANIWRFSSSLPVCSPLLSTATPSLTEFCSLLSDKLHPQEWDEWDGGRDRGRLPPLAAASAVAVGSVIGAEKPKTNSGLWDQSLVQSTRWFKEQLCHYWTERGKDKRHNSALM